MACPLLAGRTGMCAGARSSAGAAAGGERSGACKGTGKLTRCGSAKGAWGSWTNRKGVFIEGEFCFSCLSFEETY